MKPKHRDRVCKPSFINTIKHTDMHVAPLSVYRRSIPTSERPNPLDPKLVSGVSAPILEVSGCRTDAEVFPPIIKWIAIDMVSLLSALYAKYHSPEKACPSFHLAGGHQVAVVLNLCGPVVVEKMGVLRGHQPDIAFGQVGKGMVSAFAESRGSGPALARHGASR